MKTNQKKRIRVEMYVKREFLHLLKDKHILNLDSAHELPPLQSGIYSKIYVTYSPNRK